MLPEEPQRPCVAVAAVKVDAIAPSDVIVRNRRADERVEAQEDDSVLAPLCRED